MTRGPLIGVLVGIASLAWVFFSGAMGGVPAVLQTAGWGGLAAVSLAHIPSLLLCALAWQVLGMANLPGPSPSLVFYLYLRWVRDAVGNLLSAIPLAGEIVATRMLAERAGGTVRAGAIVAVDSALELAALPCFAVLGMAAFVNAFPLTVFDRELENALGWSVIALATLGVIGVGWCLMRIARPDGPLERLSLRLTLGVSTGLAENAGKLLAMTRALLAQRKKVASSRLLHLAAWAVGALESWVALWAIGTGAGWSELLVLEALVFSARTIAFFVPSGIGIQEGAFVAAGGLVGLAPEQALAVAALRRGREVVLGMPVLVTWPVAELRARSRVLRNPPSPTDCELRAGPTHHSH